MRILLKNKKMENGAIGMDAYERFLITLKQKFSLDLSGYKESKWREELIL